MPVHNDIFDTFYKNKIDWKIINRFCSLAEILDNTLLFNKPTFFSLTSEEKYRKDKEDNNLERLLRSFKRLEMELQCEIDGLLVLSKCVDEFYEKACTITQDDFEKGIYLEFEQFKEDTDPLLILLKQIKLERKGMFDPENKLLKIEDLIARIRNIEEIFVRQQKVNKIKKLDEEKDKEDKLKRLRRSFKELEIELQGPIDGLLVLSKCVDEFYEKAYTITQDDFENGIYLEFKQFKVDTDPLLILLRQIKLERKDMFDPENKLLEIEDLIDRIRNIEERFLRQQKVNKKKKLDEEENKIKKKLDEEEEANKIKRFLKSNPFFRYNSKETDDLFYRNIELTKRIFGTYNPLDRPVPNKKAKKAKKAKPFVPKDDEKKP